LKRPSFFKVLWPTAAFGLFAARCLYELDPIGLWFLRDLAGTFIFLLLVIGLGYGLAMLILRVSPHADQISLPSLGFAPLLLLLLFLFQAPVDLRWALVLFLGTLFLMAQDAIPARQLDRFYTIGVGLIVFVLYLLTLGDQVGRADTFEFQVVAPQLGIAHPTGYPLYILLGKLFSLLPVGSMAWRVNLASAIFGTLAVLLIYRLIVRVSDRAGAFTRLPAALAAFALAGSNVFWSQAVIAEVYALDALFVAIVLSLLHRMLTERDQSAARSIYLLGLVLGLALTHHLTSVILIPAALLTLLLARPQLPFKKWVTAFGCLLLGLTPWLYIPLRWPALHNGAAMGLSDWFGWIFGQRFGGALNFSLWSNPTRWGIVGRIGLDQFGVIGLLLALIGLIVLFKRNWRLALITLMLFAGYVFYGLVYNVPDVDVFIIPAFLMLAIWLGLALEALLSRREVIRSNIMNGTLHTLRRPLVILLALLPLSLIATNYPLVDQRGVDADLAAWGRYVLSLPIPDHAALLVDSEKIAPLYYLQVTKQLRPDLDILVLGEESLYRQELDQRLAAGQAVFLARFLPNLPYHLSSLGPLVAVSSAPNSISPQGQTIDAAFGGTLKLLSTSIDTSDPLRVTFFWQALTAERPNYHVRLRLVDSNGTVWWEDPGAHPVGGYYPTGAWSLNEIVSDFHEIKVEPFVPAGEYDLEVGLFTPFRPDGLKLDSGSLWARAARVTITPPPIEPLPHRVRLAYGQSFVVTSVESGNSVPPNSDVTLRVNAIGTDPRADGELLLFDGTGTLASSSSVVLRTGQSRLTFRAPAKVGTYYLRLNIGRTVSCGWLALLNSDCTLGTLRVEGEAIGSALNFDNQVLLTGAQIDRTQLRPGEAIHVDLTWRGLKTWDGDYTVFVHLIGPDGRVHGQVDQWPVEGTLPTSSWGAGQVVADPYVVALPADAPSGQYQIEVGWYLLATLRRLPVLDAAGRPSDDHVIVGSFSVP
jgi:hypothetical protein